MMNSQKKIIKPFLAFVLLMLGLILGAIVFVQWILFGNSYLDFPYLIALKEYYQEYIPFLLDDNPAQNSFIRYVVPLILFFISISVVSIVVLFFLLIIRRFSKLRQEIVDKIHNNRVEKLIIEYLYTQSPFAVTNLKLFSKARVIKPLVVLHENIIGNKASLTNALFYELKLDAFVAKKIDSIFWHVRIKYMLVASSMNIVSVIDKIKRNINDQNSDVRNAAQNALLTLDKSHSFDFLHQVDYPISKWQQISLHRTIVRESIPLPNFGDFLMSKNDTVVIFALIMIESFYQRDNAEKVIALLKHSNEAIRHQALHVVKALDYKEAAPELIAKFSNESTHIQVDIVEALAKFDTPDSVDFLKKLLEKSDFKINWAIIKNMSSSTLKKIVGDNPPSAELEKMIKHLAYLKN